MVQSQEKFVEFEVHIAVKIKSMYLQVVIVCSSKQPYFSQ
jgi:hypothetical protein